MSFNHATMGALSHANYLKRVYYDTRVKIRAGHLTVSDALNDPLLKNMKVSDLLAAQPRWGEHRVARCLRDAEVLNGAGFGSLERRVGDLTERQVDLLREVLR